MSQPRSEGAPTHTAASHSLGSAGGSVSCLALSACPRWAEWSAEVADKSLHSRSRYGQLEVGLGSLEGSRAVCRAQERMTNDAPRSVSDSVPHGDTWLASPIFQILLPLWEKSSSL